MLAKLTETQLWKLPESACWEVGGINKEAMVSVWEKTAPPTLTLKPDNSISSHMSLTPFKLLPQSWSSEGLSPSPSKFAHEPFKRNVYDERYIHIYGE